MTAGQGHPRARRAGLLVETVAGETIVYDLERHRGHCLNDAATRVWRACDGRRSPAEIARAVGAELGHPVDAAWVQLALRRLARARLLTAAPDAASSRVSRREVARRLGLVGAMSVLLPTVLSIVAPTVVQAATNACTAGQCLFGGAARRGCCCTNNNRRCIRLGMTAFNFCGGAAC